MRLRGAHVILPRSNRKKKAHLEREALDLQAQSAKKAEEGKIAGAAQERLIQFRQRLGADVRYCPDCLFSEGSTRRSSRSGGSAEVCALTDVPPTPAPSPVGGHH